MLRMVDNGLPKLGSDATCRIAGGWSNKEWDQESVARFSWVPMGFAWGYIGTNMLFYEQFSDCDDCAGAPRCVRAVCSGSGR